MKRILSWFLRKDSKMPLMPSPGIPKTVSTPHLSNFSTITSPVVVAMGPAPRLWILGGRPRHCVSRDSSSRTSHVPIAEALRRNIGSPAFSPLRLEKLVRSFDAATSPDVAVKKQHSP